MLRGGGEDWVEGWVIEEKWEVEECEIQDTERSKHMCGTIHCLA